MVSGTSNQVQVALRLIQQRLNTLYDMPKPVMRSMSFVSSNVPNGPIPLTPGPFYGAVPIQGSPSVFVNNAPNVLVMPDGKHSSRSHIPNYPASQYVSQPHMQNAQSQFVPVQAQSVNVPQYPLPMHNHVNSNQMQTMNMYPTNQFGTPQPNTPNQFIGPSHLNKYPIHGHGHGSNPMISFPQASQSPNVNLPHAYPNSEKHYPSISPSTSIPNFNAQHHYSGAHEVPHSLTPRSNNSIGWNNHYQKPATMPYSNSYTFGPQNNQAPRYSINSQHNHIGSNPSYRSNNSVFENNYTSKGPLESETSSSNALNSNADPFVPFRSSSLPSNIREPLYQPQRN